MRVWLTHGLFTNPDQPALLLSPAGWSMRWAPAHACVALFTAAIGRVRRLGHW